MYSFLKDFAGPIATIIASGVAAYFVRQQWLTAEKQANTAIDQLRYNLFEKRYAIYDDVKQLLRLLLNDSHEKNFRPFDVDKHYVVMDEAMFFFSPETCLWLKSVKQDCQKFMEANASLGKPEHNSMEHTNTQRKLLDDFQAMPERFRNELSFRQLTQKGAHSNAASLS
jgi:hypothetical protein